MGWGYSVWLWRLS